ncbi:MAG: hypothetical protein AAGK14_14760 [Verrucomicrobiota bacterium]
MRTAPLLLLLLAASLGQAALVVDPSDRIRLSDDEALEVGKRIWQNECAGTIKGLTTWNQGEEFPSLGICHFIWYPEGVESRFEESFPSFLRFAMNSGVKLPSWMNGLSPDQDSPWSSRSEFYREFDSPEMKELRQFLADNVPLQARFAARRAEHALPKLLKATAPERQEEIEDKFYQVAGSPGGVYALIDYVNFKGEGTNPKERYQGEGWGLLQVLELAPIRPGQNMDETMAAFREGAQAALARRVKNSPPERGEKRWTKGWNNRIATYKN